MNETLSANFKCSNRNPTISPYRIWDRCSYYCTKEVFKHKVHQKCLKLQKDTEEWPSANNFIAERRASIISIRTQSTNVDRFPQANRLDPARIALIDKAPAARPRGSTRRGGFVPGLVAVLSSVLALPPGRVNRQPRPPHRLPPPPRRAHSQRADPGGKRGQRRRLGMPRREARPTGLQVEGPHDHGWAATGAVGGSEWK